MSDHQKRSYSLAETAASGVKLEPIRWHASPLPRDTLRVLTELHDGPAVRDTLIWLALLVLSGVGAVLTWGTWWCVPFFVVYGTLYGSSSDSRWHECGHRTAFKSEWMNEALYQLASFMILREPLVWRRSHQRHHRETGYVGRDSEVFVPRPANLAHLLANVFQIRSTLAALGRLVRHGLGRIDADEATYIPDNEHASVTKTARIWLAILLATFLMCVATGSILPAMLIGLPTIYGSFFVFFFGLTQHAGLAEDVPDHRLNTRTVMMNPLFRFLYWNMNYHVEHHMYPRVPYHALPKLHALIKDDCPPPYPSLWAAYREILPALWRQSKDPTYFVRRPLPERVT